MMSRQAAPEGKKDGAAGEPPLADSIRTIERAAGALATARVARMDEVLPWFRELPADQRAWVMLVAQAGVRSLVEWLRRRGEADGGGPQEGSYEVFDAAPRALARSINLQQTVQLIRITIEVAEEQVPHLTSKGEEQAMYEAVLRFSREIAFAAARVYARAAETRGAWDARLQALVIDGLVRGARSTEAGSPVSQLAALGWRAEGAVTTVVGSAPLGPGPTPGLGSGQPAGPPG